MKMFNKHKWKCSTNISESKPPYCQGFWRPLPSSGMVARVNGREGHRNFGKKKKLEILVKLRNHKNQVRTAREDPSSHRILLPNSGLFFLRAEQVVEEVVYCLKFKYINCQVWKQVTSRRDILRIMYNIKTSSNIAYMSALIKTMRVIPASQGGLSRRQAHGDFFQKNLHKMFPVWEREWVLWSHL